MPFFPAIDAPLAGSAIRLRPAAERDIPEVLIAHQDDPELYVRLGLQRPPSGAELGRRVEESAHDSRTGAGAWLTILAGGSDECQGQVDVYDIDWDHRRGEVGIWVAPGIRGRGLATEALGVAGHWLLEDCGLERVQILSEPGNAPMLGAARAAGFADEGVLRAYLSERGRRIDVTVMSLVAGDLEAK